MQINLKTFHDEEFTCPKCEWKGKGSELDTENVSEEHWIFDFECPKCDQHIGSGQAPLIESEEANNEKQEKCKELDNIFELLGEGGSITFYKEYNPKTLSDWYYYEVYDMGFEEEDIPPSKRRSLYCNTFWEALMRLYFEKPYFYRLYPNVIDEEFKDDIISLLRLVRSQSEEPVSFGSYYEILELEKEELDKYLNM